MTKLLIMHVSKNKTKLLNDRLIGEVEYEVKK